MRPDSRKRNIAVKLAEHRQTNVLRVTPGPSDNIPNDVIIIIVNKVRKVKFLRGTMDTKLVLVICTTTITMVSTF